MSWSLRQFPDALALVAERVAQATGIPMAHVEKDFWVTEALRGLAVCSAATGVSIVFKGGTSLSKAFGLIQRFSEDVDVIVVVPGNSKGQNDRLLKQFVAAAEESTGLESTVDPRTATKGMKRTATLTYPTGSTSGALRSGVLLELGTRGGAMPTSQRQVASLIVEHWPGEGMEADFAEAEPVALRVLAPVRTLIEKLMILHHAALTGDAVEQQRLARHYYDVWCLLRDNGTVTALSESPADVLAREVSTFTEAAGLGASARPANGFAASPAFDYRATGPARSVYESIVLDQLLWPEALRPSLEDCCGLVQSHADLL